MACWSCLTLTVAALMFWDAAPTARDAASCSRASFSTASEAPMASSRISRISSRLLPWVAANRSASSSTRFCAADILLKAAA